MPNPRPKLRHDRLAAKREALLQTSLQNEKIARIEYERDLLKKQRVDSAAKDLANTQAVVAQNAWQLRSTARHWFSTSIAAANLAGLWAAFSATTLSREVRLEALYWFIGGVVAALIAGLAEQGIAQRDWARARMSHVQAVTSLALEDTQALRSLYKMPPRYDIIVAAVVALLEAVPIVALGSGLKVLLAAI